MPKHTAIASDWSTSIADALATNKNETVAELLGQRENSGIAPTEFTDVVKNLKARPDHRLEFGSLVTLFQDRPVANGWAIAWGNWSGGSNDIDFQLFNQNSSLVGGGTSALPTEYVLGSFGSNHSMNVYEYNPGFASAYRVFKIGQANFFSQ